MPKNMDVGRGWRSAAKHELMNKLVGEEIGVTGLTNSIGRRIYRNCLIDLTAGDAALHDAEWHRGCSPGILAYNVAVARQPKPAVIDLYEINEATYRRLLEHLAEHLPEFGYVRTQEQEWRIDDRVIFRVFHASGRDADVTHIRTGDAVFVLNDPNAMTDWAMRDTFADEIATKTWCFRSLSTMGCNPSGIKRLDFTERRGWFDIVGNQERALPKHRDLLLAAIERDDAQWAYLISTASVWRERTEKTVRAAFNKIGRTVAMAWCRQEPVKFDDAKLSLFLTRKELDRLANTPLPGLDDDGSLPVG